MKKHLYRLKLLSWKTKQNDSLMLKADIYNSSFCGIIEKMGMYKMTVINRKYEDFSDMVLIFYMIVNIPSGFPQISCERYF